MGDKDTNTPTPKRFDMYRFFSRWDILAMIAFILLMLFIILRHLLVGGGAA